MPTPPPLTTALLIVLAVSFAGAFIAYLRDRGRFRGYEELTAEALRLGRQLRGDVFRDGNDLVISGAWRNLPVQVRFSHTENTPGLNIRMAAPASFTLSVMPARSPAVAGRVLVHTPDERFNARFAVRSDHPTHARMFLSARNVFPLLLKLCRSAQDLLLISADTIEFSDLGAPGLQSAQTVSERVEHLGDLVQELRAMPGAEQIKIERPVRHRHLFGRIALAVGVVTSIVLLVMAALPHHGKNAAAESGGPAASEEAQLTKPSGIPAADAARISNLAEWRLASPGDFDPAAAAWLRERGRDPQGRVEGNFCLNRPDDAAYLLVGPDNQTHRLVILCEGEVMVDLKYPFVGLATRVPHDLIASIDWVSAPPQAPEADGLLITRKPDDPASGLVLFPHGQRIVSGVPRNYQTVKLD